MKITETTVKRITISDLPDLDPIRVTLEDIAPAKGRISIECYDKAWTAGWGGMGKDRGIAQFFMDCDEHYLAKNLSNIDAQVFDPDVLLDYMKREVVNDRRQHSITREEARERFDAIEDIDLPEHEQALWCMQDTMHEILGDEWWYRIPHKPNPDYEYLTRIIRTVQAALESMQVKA